MKDILSKLKTEIPKLMSEVKAVHVLADPDILPETTQFPCMGIKDGPTPRSEGLDETVSLTDTIYIYIYVQILKDEASIMGDGGQKGVLELMDDLLENFDHNLLGNIVESAFCPEVFASETMLAAEDVFIQRKGCRYVYERSE